MCDVLKEVNNNLIKNYADKIEDLLKDAITYTGTSLLDLEDIKRRGLLKTLGNGDIIFSFDGVDLLLWTKPEFKMECLTASYTGEFRKLYEEDNTLKS